jgi:3-oxoacyl-[acyl-carrier-protein] synthase-1/3-oxoacyl-[acyl-carrier-protein] synthase II
MRVFVAGMGAVTPAGIGTAPLWKAVGTGARCLRPLSLFPAATTLPAGEADLPESLGRDENPNLPRTHRMALAAAREALLEANAPPDAVVIGGTTGGMLTTEDHWKAGTMTAEALVHHGTGTVAELLAETFGCRGPVLTVSTACSSGAAVLKLALELLRGGHVRSVLAGGADSLCRLSYYGFHSLQLIDPEMPRPFDANRRGMSVAEAAGMLLLVAAETPPPNAVAEVRGAGLSCDAHHPTAPEPEGKGAFQAIRSALADAGLPPSAIDYVNLHGTGTPDNDRSEACALAALFEGPTPPASSVKGALGHSLAAAGAVEAVISALAIARGQIPGHVGRETADPEMDQLRLAESTAKAAVRAVLSNSFGFGGNNAAVVLAAPEAAAPASPARPRTKLRVRGTACLTGAGFLEGTAAALNGGTPFPGALSLAELSEGLPVRLVRRLKRLPRMALALASAALENAGEGAKPAGVFWGTGWGALSETHDFLNGLFESGERFPSPTDFIGSVHNAPAGIIATHFGAKGPNLTLTGGDESFEQALLAASLAGGDVDGPFLLLGADEHHPVLSPLLDASVAATSGASADGGGALLVEAVRANSELGEGVSIAPVFLAPADSNSIENLLEALGGPGRIRDQFALILTGIPAAFREAGNQRLSRFREAAGFHGPILDYRRFTGEFASASATAAALAVHWVRQGHVPALPVFQTGLDNEMGGDPVALENRGILILGLGKTLTAVEVSP